MKRFAQYSLLTAAAAGLVLASPATAQSRRMMVVEDDGAGPQFVHFSGPNMRELREPDFTRDDLPIFERRLTLDTIQVPQVRTLLDEYLEAFMGLVKTTLPPQENMAFKHRMGDHDGHGGAGDIHDPENNAGAIGDFLIQALDGEMGDIDFEGEPGTSMIVAVTAGGPGGAWTPGGGEFEGDMDVTIDAEAGEGGPGVMIAFDGPEGMELSEEQIKKLQEHAEELAAHLQEQMENGEMGEDGGLHMMAPMGIEEHELQFDRMREMAEEMEAGKKLLRRQFIQDVQTTLRPEQLDRWPDLDRALTRKKTLPKGRLDGERTDLVAITEDLGLTETDNESLREQLHAYELTLHDALTRRNAFLIDAEQRIDKAVSEGNPETALSVVDRATQTRVAVRSVNDQFTDALAGTLDAQAGEAFREQVRKKSYPRVYRKTSGLKVFEQARQLDGLDERTLVNILELEQPYRAELDRINTRLVDAIRKEQPLEPRQGIEHMAAAMNGELIEFGSEKDPVQTVKTERRELEERYVKQLHALLSPEQVERLPKMPKYRSGPMFIQRSNAQ